MLPTNQTSIEGNMEQCLINWGHYLSCRGNIIGFMWILSGVTELPPPHYTLLYYCLVHSELLIWYSLVYRFPLYLMGVCCLSSTIHSVGEACPEILCTLFKCTKYRRTCIKRVKCGFTCKVKH